MSGRLVLVNRSDTPKSKHQGLKDQAPELLWLNTSQGWAAVPLVDLTGKIEESAASGRS